jgi:heat shock protein HslJ
MMKKVCFISLVTCLMFVTISCESTGKMSLQKQLLFHVWDLNTLNGKVLDMNDFTTRLPFLVFDKNGMLSGSTGCNKISGNYELKKSELILTPGAMTRMACQGNGESLFLDALNRIRNCKIEGDKLTLLNGETEIMTMVIKR